MNIHKKSFYKIQAETVIKKMQERGMEGFYFDNINDAKKKILELINNSGKTVAYGGSMTLDECGIKKDIVAAGYDLIKREELSVEECNVKTINADSFLMSSNAITLNGELVNIDKRGNRVCYLIYGPKQIIILAGMNKITSDIDDAIKRIRSKATIPNAIRLKLNTPCLKTCKCVDCKNESLCANIVTTRTSCPPGRIKVLLVGEELGY